MKRTQLNLGLAVAVTGLAVAVWVSREKPEQHLPLTPIAESDLKSIAIAHPDAKTIRLLGRVDIWYALSAAAVLLTGLLRLGFGAKGADFHLGAWPIYVKIGLFLAVGVMSVIPTLEFVRWRRELDHDGAWQLPAERQAKMRRIVMIEVHLAALIPVFAVMTARGLGR